MIRDRIVSGLRDHRLSEKLQLDSNLTLTTAISLARESEMVKKQQPLLRGQVQENQTLEVGAVQRQTLRRQPRPPLGRQPQNPPLSQSGTCQRCGHAPAHDRQKCPARQARCRKCGKLGLFQAVCRTKSVSEVRLEDANDLDAFLGTVQSGDKHAWKIKLPLDEQKVEWRIDTGADVTAIPEKLFKQLPRKMLLPVYKTVRGAGQQLLSVKGRFRTTLKKGGKAMSEEIYVIPNLKSPLLGVTVIEALGLAAQLQVVADELNDPAREFPHLFKGLGKTSAKYRITLQEGAEPYAINVPRRIAIPLMPKVKAEIERMARLGVISRIEEPTKWCAGMVVVPKSGGKVRICVDLTRLNHSVQRERHILPAVDQTLARVAGATVFSKLDANSGFWQIPLAPESRPLTTFLTPFGRYCFNRLPFGITSAPEYFQHYMSKVLEGLEGTVCLIDDILVYGAEEHDAQLRAVLKRLEAEGLTLNRDKCSFKATRVKFLGHVIDGSGISPDPEKISVICKLKEPQNVSELRRFLGMANQMSKFAPNLAETTKPLRDLLNKKSQWVWDSTQEQAFQVVKQSLSSSPVLALYDPSLETAVSADASSFGLGAVLLQREPEQEWRPVTYISRAMTSTETRYAQNEKALA